MAHLFLRRACCTLAYRTPIAARHLVSSRQSSEVRWQFFSFSTHSTGEDDKGSKDGCAPDNNAADEPNIVDVLTSMEKNNTENVDKMADDFFKSDKVTDSFPKLEKESDEISALGVLKEMQFETEVSNETEATMNVDLKGDPEEDFTGFLAEETSEENEDLSERLKLEGTEDLQAAMKSFEAADILKFKEEVNMVSDPRDELDRKRTIGDVQRYSVGRMDTRQYLKELEKLPIMHVRSTHNNTYIDICDNTGRILTWKSSGSMGFKNSRRGTTFAAQSAGQAAALKAKEFGFEKVRVKLKGLGQGRQNVLKGFQLEGLQIMSLQDVTPVPHNGCRPKKKRRV